MVKGASTNNLEVNRWPSKGSEAQMPIMAYRLPQPGAGLGEPALEEGHCSDDHDPFANQTLLSLYLQHGSFWSSANRAESVVSTRDMQTAEPTKGY